MGSSLFHTLNISRQDILSRLLDLDVTSNNLANMNTTGFKASRTNFQELLDARTLEGMHIAGTQMMTRSGALRASDNPLDWAIQGEGFFTVRLPNGTNAYTRDGQFVLDANRNLVNSSGYPLVWEGQIPAGMVDISLRPDGVVEALLENGERVVAGRVQLTRFANPTALASHGNNVWLETDSSGAPQVGTAGSANLGWIQTHAVEQSNVDLSYEMTNLMMLQRSFQLSVRTFQQTDSMIAQALTLRKG